VAFGDWIMMKQAGIALGAYSRNIRQYGHEEEHRKKLWKGGSGTGLVNVLFQQTPRCFGKNPTFKTEQYDSY
jgi:hypothetical protein